jgi:hypothetical protein
MQDDELPIFDYAVISVESDQRVELASDLLYVERDTVFRATGPDFEYDPESTPEGTVDLTWKQLPEGEHELLDASFDFGSTDATNIEPERDALSGHGRLKKNGTHHGGGVVAVRDGTGRFRGKSGLVRVRIQNPKRWRIVGGDG